MWSQLERGNLIQDSPGQQTMRVAGWRIISGLKWLWFLLPRADLRIPESVVIALRALMRTRRCPVTALLMLEMSLLTDQLSTMSRQVWRTLCLSLCFQNRTELDHLQKTWVHLGMPQPQLLMQAGTSSVRAVFFLLSIFWVYLLQHKLLLLT